MLTGDSPQRKKQLPKSLANYVVGFVVVAARAMALNPRGHGGGQPGPESESESLSFQGLNSLTSPAPRATPRSHILHSPATKEKIHITTCPPIVSYRQEKKGCHFEKSL